MKSIAIKVRKPLPPQILKEADQEPVLLTVRGKPRYILRSLKPSDASRLAEKPDTSEDPTWVESASSQLLSAYGDQDSIYDDL